VHLSLKISHGCNNVNDFPKNQLTKTTVWSVDHKDKGIKFSNKLKLFSIIPGSRWWNDNFRQ